MHLKKQNINLLKSGCGQMIRLAEGSASNL